MKDQSQEMETGTYSSRRDLDADLLDGLGELLRLDSAVVVQVKVLERLREDGLLSLGAAGFLHELVLEFSLKTGGVSVESTYLVLRCSILYVRAEGMLCDNG